MSDAFSELHRSFIKAGDRFRGNPYPSVDERKAVLRRLKHSLIAYERPIYQALNEDYGYRSEFETLLADVLPTLSAINYSLKHLSRWMKPARRRTGIRLFPSKLKVHYQPKGVVGVISPWNFPVYLALVPAVQAIAAGNRVLLKLSEFTPATNQLTRNLLAEVSDYITVVEGGAMLSEAFSQLPFDHILFTGSTGVGKQVANAAAENLCPATLELGGKSPLIIAPDARMNNAVDAMILGKLGNAGQLCVAPDYAFVPAHREQEFTDCFVRRYREYYVDDENHNRQTSIFSDKHYARLEGLLADAQHKGAVIHPVLEQTSKVRSKNVLSEVRRGYADLSKQTGPLNSEGSGMTHGRYFPPYLVSQLSQDMAIMQEEIFGPLLPVIPYESVDEVLSYINARPKPLALYLMSTNTKLIENVLRATHSGGVCVNDTVLHVTVDDAPFGGVGSSGTGRYHGFEGFCTFSNVRTVLTSHGWNPRNRYLLKHRDLAFRLLRKFYLG